MNVFKKISSSSIFQTQKKPTHNLPQPRIPQSAQKLASNQQQCFYLIDYEVRGHGVVICRLTKDQNLMKKIGWRKLNSQLIECTIKSQNPNELWIGKHYWFKGIKKLQQNQDLFQLMSEELNATSKTTKYIADKAFMINISIKKERQ